MSLPVEFVCPESHRPLHLASEDELSDLRDAIRSGVAARRDGEPPPEFEGAWLTKDGGFAYLVVEGVPNFLLEERIEVRR